MTYDIPYHTWRYDLQHMTYDILGDTIAHMGDLTYGWITDERSDDNDDQGQPAYPVGDSAGQSQDGAIAVKSLSDEDLSKEEISSGPLATLAHLSSSFEPPVSRR
jgi:hypothetical protein